MLRRAGTGNRGQGDSGGGAGIARGGQGLRLPGAAESETQRPWVGNGPRLVEAFEPRCATSDRVGHRSKIAIPKRS